MADAASNLVGTIRGAASDGDDAWATATVKALVGGAPARVTVTLDGTDQTIPRLKTYAPVVGEVALLGRIGAAPFAIGALG